MMPVADPAQPPRLLEQVRELICYKHYSLKTEEAYVYWVSFLVRWRGRSGRCDIRAKWEQMRFNSFSRCWSMSATFRCPHTTRPRVRCCFCAVRTDRFVDRARLSAQGRNRKSE